MPNRIRGFITPNNTTVDVQGDTIAVTLHRTTILRVEGGIVTLNSGGWQTVTTKRRLNEAAKAFGLGFAVWQKDFEWFVTVDLPGGRMATVEFEDGMAFDVGLQAREDDFIESVR